ncbi:MAG: hypothetical protein ACD_79C00864G0003 [uncultured bacterium]|nr:MAG: hypothetical protein ACD_79C00864G0003 [uncultured bacterium]
MKINEVPNDNNKIYQGYGTKLLYALNDKGLYSAVPSTGWEVEEIVLRDVINDFQNKAAEARQKVLNRETSPIEYYMNKNLLDPASLAYGVNMFEWRVKRHFKPAVFDKLSEKVLKLYADFFKITINRLKNIQADDTPL